VTTQTVELQALTIDHSLQTRVDGIDADLVQRFVEDMGRGEVFPPIAVVQNGKAAWVWDGFHRVAAAQKLGLAELPAVVTHGTFEDAQDLAFSLPNRKHGKPATRDDIRQTIRAMLLTERWVQRADNWIAEHVGCHNVTASKQRDEMVAAYQIDKLSHLVGKDGKSYPRKYATAESTLVIRDTYTLADWASLDAKTQRAILKSAADMHDTAGFNKQDTDNIEWAKWSWNPVTGCKHNCPYCYARDIAQRFYPQGFEPVLHPRRLKAPQRVVVPPDASTDLGFKNVFTCSMADLFGRWVPQAWIEAVLRAMDDAPQWNFLLLTKFPMRLSEFEFPDNVWVGTSVDCQARVANAERAFRKVNAKVKWLSCEPLIEPLKFSDLSMFQWVVIGGASSSTQTPAWQPPRAWVDALSQSAWASGCRVYEKTNLLRRWRQYPGHDDTPPPAAPDVFNYLKRSASDDERVESA
jgi:protein gp37